MKINFTCNSKFIVCFFIITGYLNICKAHNTKTPDKVTKETFFTTIRPTDTLKVSSNFESGSARVLALDPVKQVVRITPAGNPRRGWPNWWFLRLDGVDTSKPLTLEVIASNQLIFSDNAGETKQLPPGWSLPFQATFSTDGTNWHHSAPGVITNKQATYRIQPVSHTIWFAWGPPFTHHDAMAFVTQTAKLHPAARAFTLCQSHDNRPVPALQISEGNKPASQRPAIWIDARQHAWETGGSWVGVGFVEWLLSNDEHAKWLRMNTEVFFVPVMDVDHVSTGDGGKNALPQDHNMDWTDLPHWPEVAASQKHILALTREGRMSVFLDLHNPGSGNSRQTAYVIDKAYMPEKAEPRKLRFVELLIEQFGDLKQIAARPPADNPEIFHAVSVPWVLEYANPNTIAFCIETPWNIPQGTTDGYRKVGQKLGQAVEKLLKEN